ncbi:integrase core domain containing protein [Aphelenchoides avenae]|nr:integrase core domain containing protein [Aphelenchus avenae]
MLSTLNNTVFARVGIDATGPFRTTDRGNRKYLISVPVPDLRSVTLANVVIEHVVLKFGCPTELISDNAKTFSSDFFQELCAKLGINKRFSTPYHSQGNAATERSFRSIQDAISKLVNDRHDDWDLIAPYVTFCHNVTCHDTTGESPFFLLMGRDPVFSVQQLLDPDFVVPLEREKPPTDHPLVTHSYRLTT